MLYPVTNAFRWILDLCGIWKFRIDQHASGEQERWFRGGWETFLSMPVPASYNDITQDVSLRDHVGDVWYEREVLIPTSIRPQRIELRFDAVAHHARVWLDGLPLGDHAGGYLPFDFDVTDRIHPGARHRLTVKVNNILSWQTLPPGEIRIPDDKENYPPGYRWQETHFDFFNYSGIHRPVRLVLTPRTRIETVRIETGFDGEFGWVDYVVESSSAESARIAVALRDERGLEVAAGTGGAGRLKVMNPHPWAPGHPHLYTLECILHDGLGTAVDCYSERVGIRTVRVENGKLLLNGTPIYLKGFGRHEDLDVKGRALDLAWLVKDHNLMEWIGANSFRTSHYPYSEEAMRMADERGILVIDEVPAVGMNTWSDSPHIFAPDKVNDEALRNHLQTLTDLIERDRNHPSVILWSVANEAATWEPASLPYFERVFAHVRTLDPNRPITIVEAARALNEPNRVKASRVAHLADVIGINRYYGWYNDSGHLELVARQLERELRTWWSLYGKPILLAEYGSDTIAGFHCDPPAMFSEEFQAAFLEEYHRALDSCDFVVGEHVWNFADFATKQSPGRALGNRKGVFTRQRHPKLVAQVLRKRWLGREYDNASKRQGPFATDKPRRASPN